MNISTSIVDLASHECDAICIAVRKDNIREDLAPLGTEVADMLAGAAASEEFKARAGKARAYASLGRAAARHIVLVGVGDGSARDIWQGAGAAGNRCRSLGAETVAAHFGCDGAELELAVRGFVEGNYRFDKYKSEDGRRPATASLTAVGSLTDGAIKGIQAVTAGQALARDLVNEPAAVIYPETLADAARAIANDRITVEVWDHEKIAAAGMGGITGVGQGSDRKARFIHLHYKPAGTPRQTVALVGKGVTFDAGGLSLKPSAGMQTMRCDMGGSAAVLGAFRALADIQPNVEVHGVIGAVENMVSGNSYKLGDVLKMYNGKNVEIHNTDAEGRLVLADCLAWVSMEHKPDAIVNLATLTGAIVIALGPNYTGLFSQDDGLASELLAAADGASEGLWRMPMPEDYRELLKADWAQIKNVGGRPAGSTTAALFLSEFVENDVPFAHLDIAGSAFNEKQHKHYAAGATGAPVATLVDWVRSRS